MRICEECGELYEPNDARSRFNNFFSETSRWQYDEVIHESLCFDCATDKALDLYEDNIIEDEYLDLD